MIAWFARNHVAANLLMIAIILSGLLAIKRNIPLEFLPDIDFHSVTITTVLPGGTPDSMAKTITSRIEEAIADIEGIKKIRSRSGESVSNINAEIDTNYDQHAVLSDIKVRVDALNTLPQTAERPTVQLRELRIQVIGITIAGNVSHNALYQAAEDFREELINTKGVTQVGLLQTPKREIHIELSPHVLQKYQLTLGQVAQIISDNSRDFPAGTLDTQQGIITLQANEQANKATDFARIPIIQNTQGVIYLEDIAQLTDGFRLFKVETEFNGMPAVTLEVYRTGKEDTLTVANATQDFIKNYIRPPGINIATYGSTADIVKQRLDTLISSAIQGGILVLIVLSLFLRPAVALWVGIGIPVCFLGAFSMMPVLGLSLNMLSMFAYILVLGIVVDDAIVTGENIYRHTRLGMSAQKAALFGTQEVAIPVTFGVITTMVAFLPLLMIEGSLGSLTKQIPLVIIPVLAFSLIESKLILPAHMSTIAVRDEQNMSGLSRFQQQFSRKFEESILSVYRPLLRYCLQYKSLTLGIATSVFIITMIMVGSGWVRVSFFPSFSDNAIVVNLSMPTTTGYETTKKNIQHIVKSANSLADEFSDPKTKKSYFKNQFSVTGLNFSNDGGSSFGVNKGIVYVELITVEEGLPYDFSIKDVEDKLRETIGQIPGAEKLEMSSSSSDFGKPLSITLYSNNTARLKDTVTKTRDFLATFPGVFDVQDNIFSGKEEIQLTLKPLAHTLGITQNEIANQVRNVVYGVEAQRIQKKTGEVNVMLRYPEEYRSSVVDLKNLPIRIANQPTTVALSDLATLSNGSSPISVYREKLRRTVNVTADINTESTDANIIREDVETFLKNLLNNHQDIEYDFGGQAETQQETIQDFFFGFILIILAIYALLAIPFRSFGQPLVVMSIIPLGLIGALWGHLIMGVSFSLLSIMGILGLTGIVVNDSLVLVDYINQQRKKGNDMMHAILTAGETRFRPVILTSLTTFVGLLPLILNKSAQARALIPMAVSLGFGILIATFITLLITPVMYLCARQGKHRFLQLLGRNT